MLKRIALVLVILIAAVLIFAATRPDTFRVERTTRIDATPDKVFPLINDLRQYASWSPWEKLDPAMKRAYTGPSSGVGAVYEWEGNVEVGKGRIEITESTPPSKVVLKLDYVEPFEAHNIVEFTLRPDGGSTGVTWATHGPSPYVTKLVGLFVNMDKMVGGMFEKGLADLKTLAEKGGG